MQEKHREYGSLLSMTDIDNFDNLFIEQTSNKALALVEYKQDYEQIDLWKYQSHKWLADKGEPIPFFILVGYRSPDHPKENICYYFLPMNEACKNIDPFFGKERWLTEKQYVRLLFKLRKVSPGENDLKEMSNYIPPGLALPNIKR